MIGDDRSTCATTDAPGVRSAYALYSFRGQKPLAQPLLPRLVDTKTLHEICLDHTILSAHLLERCTEVRGLDTE